MLNVRICNTAGDVIAAGTCSESGFFPPAVAGIYNDALDRAPARSLRSCDTSADPLDYPEGGFETPEAAEDAARERWTDGDYFIVEAENEKEAGMRAIDESRTLD
jgi:hypothetical protein